MKKIMATVMMAISILFTGCSTSSSTMSGQPISSGAGTLGTQNDSQISASAALGTDSSTQSEGLDSLPASSRVSSSDAQASVKNEGNQIEVTGSNTPDIPNADCLEPYRIGFNIKNVSKKPITKILIRATDLGGCAVDVDDSLNQLPLNKTYRGTEWDYMRSIEPQEIAFCDLYVIPKQLGYQTLTFQFFMADGKTSFRNVNNNPVVVKVRFGINGGDNIPTSEPFSASDIDVGGKLVYSQDTQNHSIVFNVENTAYFSDLAGVMFKIPTKDYAGYKIETMRGGTVDIENGYYVWKFPQELARRSGENITINCPLSIPPRSGFDFYTLDGKIKISTCQITLI